MRRGDSAAGRRRRPFFGPDEGSSEVSTVANRYSCAIWMKRARRSVVSALRASSKQHSAKRSNCLGKVAIIARKQCRCVEQVRRAAFGGAAAARSGEVTEKTPPR